MKMPPLRGPNVFICRYGQSLEENKHTHTHARARYFIFISGGRIGNYLKFII